MGTHFDVYEPLKSRKKEFRPKSPEVRIQLVGYRIEPDGRNSITLGPGMTSDAEIDSAVRDLVEELEATRKKAKKALKASLANMAAGQRLI
jgi:hypothetical protein